ncbi:TPA: virulence factor TspB C-terminal domain-related protein [Pseudomonas aeruginosa]|nr:hypothetical protein [Pseudomonas aeruginosa]HDU9093195.1 hypothetical protein [Pseudomonas aeruginosa]
MKKLIGGATLLLFSAVCHAADYSWAYGGATFPSADAACNSYFLTVKLSVNSVNRYSVKMQSPTTALCSVYVPIGSAEGVYSSINLNRKGDSCPNGGTYDATTGSCITPPESDPCREKAGQPTSWSLLRPDLNGMGPIEYLCQNGCRVTYGSATCGPLNSDPTKGFCSGTGTFTGQQCQPTDEATGGSNPDPNPDPPDQPDPPDKPDEHGCVPPAQWSGTTCVMPPKEPGDGGDGGGEGGDGGSGGGGNNGGGDGGGDGGNNGGGDGTGGGDGSGNGDGSGDGGGTGGGDKPGEEEGKCDPAKDPSCKPSSVTGESCDADLSCEGDAIQCAILKQQKKQTCAWDYDKAKATIQAEILKDEYKLKNSSIDTGKLFSDGTSASRWLPAACPAPKVISLRLAPSQTFSWEPECQMATSLAPIIVGLASVFFAVYVGRSLGGS